MVWAYLPWAVPAFHLLLQRLTWKFAWSWRRRLLWPLKMPERNYGFRGIAQNAQSQRRKAGFVYRAHCQIQQSIADYCRRHPGVESPGCRRCFAERGTRSEEHTSELQSRPHLVCRLLLEKKKKK